MLDLNAFERQNKAESLGMVTEEGSSKPISFIFLYLQFFNVFDNNICIIYLLPLYYKTDISFVFMYMQSIFAFF